MTDSTPAPPPIRKRPRFAPALFTIFLPLAPLLFMQWGSSGAPAEKRLRVLIVVGSLIPVGVSTWLLWRGRNNLPRWAWRVGIVIGLVAVVAIFAAAVILVLRPD